jgi:acetyl esterase/lipase
LLPSLPDDVRVERNIPYAQIDGVDPKLTSLDVYAPPRGDHMPVMVFIHGGSWRMGDKRLVAFKPAAFTQRGFVFVSINYRLSPAVQHPTHVTDVANAIAWVRQNIEKYRGDPTRIYVMGHSSGAHLAALVSTDERYLKAAGAGLEVLKGAVLLDGAGYYIPFMMEEGEVGAKSIYAAAFGELLEVWKDASPTTHVASGKNIPPILIVHAGQRRTSRIQGERFGKALEDAGVEVTMVDAPDKNHLTVNYAVGRDGDALTQTIFEFLNSHPRRKDSGG